MYLGVLDFPVKMNISIASFSLCKVFFFSLGLINKLCRQDSARQALVSASSSFLNSSAYVTESQIGIFKHVGEFRFHV